nr:GNAT family N-acetyltransferase [Kibdelosporangium sp. MJ126-NF4]CEL18329.1 GCN5-related N-acetyltransferase [Kibdelosporangium sp. MJ126-NF4]CTQ97813.1 GCN5-related N-acetyltransferase [Kibdelosporangium sp. MJ126-NF4]
MNTIEESATRGRTAQDAREIAAIFAHYATNTVVTFETTPLPAHVWGRRIWSAAAAGLPFLVLVHDGAVRGFAYAAWWRPKPAYRHTVEVSIYLHPDETGRGYGRRLLDDLLTRCADAGVHQVIAVITDSGDLASTALHRAAGFEVAGKLSNVGHKQGRWVDTILMQRSLVTLRERTAGLG